MGVPREALVAVPAALLLSGILIPGHRSKAADAGRGLTALEAQGAPKSSRIRRQEQDIVAPVKGALYLQTEAWEGRHRTAAAVEKHGCPDCQRVASPPIKLESAGKRGEAPEKRKPS